MRKQIEAAKAKREKAMNAIFAHAQSGLDTFSVCKSRATEKEVAAHEAACDKIDDLERQAIAKGKAWRTSIGSVQFYK